MEFLPLIALPLLVQKGVDFARYATNRDINGMVTQLLAWLLGVVAVMIYARADWAIPISGAALNHLNTWSQVAIGLNLASIGSYAYDIKKAVDPSDSTVIPTLLPPGPRRPATAGRGVRR